MFAARFTPRAFPALALGVGLLLVACQDTPTAPALDEPASAELTPDNVSLSASLSADHPDVVPGRYIVTLKQGFRPAEIARAYGLKPHFIYDFALNGFAASIPEPALKAILRNPHVAAIEPVLITRLDAIETTSAGPEDRSDTISGGLMSHAILTQSTGSGLWGLDRTDQRYLPLSGSYSYRYTGYGVTAYIIDSGIRWDHQEFGGRVRFLYDAIGDGRNGNDCHSHGTHVAGTVGGRSVGVAKQVSLVTVRIFDCNGWGTTDQAVAGINEVIRHKYWYGRNRTAVANMSFGWYCGATTSCNNLYTAVRNMVAYGIVPVAAAGNGHRNSNGSFSPQDACTFTPARVPGTITISGTYHPNSSFGRDQRVDTWNYGSCVDWFAPGHNVLSAMHTSTTAYALKSGTSMATPHVAGAAALLLEAYPNASPAAVRDALFRRTTKSVVHNSYTTNNHMLFVNPCGFTC